MVKKIGFEHFAKGTLFVDRGFNLIRKKLLRIIVLYLLVE